MYLATYYTSIGLVLIFFCKTRVVFGKKKFGGRSLQILLTWTSKGIRSKGESVKREKKIQKKVRREGEKRK